MSDDYVDPEFPEMGGFPADENTDPEGFGQEYEAVYEGQPEESQGEVPETGEWFSPPEEPQEQVQADTQEHPVFSAPESPPQEVPQTLSQDSGGVLFEPDDDPLTHPPIVEPLAPQQVYTRFVSKRLRHLVCERRGAEYHKPAGLYRPGG